MLTISDRLIIQRKEVLWLSGEMTWVDESTPLAEDEAQRHYDRLCTRYGAENVRIVRYVTTMEVIKGGD